MSACLRSWPLKMASRWARVERTSWPPEEVSTPRAIPPVGRNGAGNAVGSCPSGRLPAGRAEARAESSAAAAAKSIKVRRFLPLPRPPRMRSASLRVRLSSDSSLIFDIATPCSETPLRCCSCAESEPGATAATSTRYPGGGSGPSPPLVAAASSSLNESPIDAEPSPKLSVNSRGAVGPPPADAASPCLRAAVAFCITHRPFTSTGTFFGLPSSSSRSLPCSRAIFSATVSSRAFMPPRSRVPMSAPDVASGTFKSFNFFEPCGTDLGGGGA